ncbi:MAG: hypothetical protein QNJ30_07770 [Kiloniellales bacterium]|nr:hypothetical protein [Kiloniellales bacterium]
MTTKAPLHGVALLGALLLLGACGLASRSGTEGLDEGALQDRKQLAQNLAKQGDLHAALLQWRIVQSFGADSGDADAASRALEAKIRKKAEAEFRLGSRALERGKLKEAQRRFLVVLSLDPEHDEAQEGLRALEAEKIRQTRRRLLGSGSKLDSRRASTPAPDTAASEPPLPRTSPRADRAARKVAEDAPKPVAAPGGDGSGKAAPKAEALTAIAQPLAPPPEEKDEKQAASLSRSEALIEKAAYRDSIKTLESHLKAYPSDRQAFELLAVSHGRVGIDLYDRGKLREALPHLQSSSDYALLSGLSDNAAVDSLLLQTRRSLAQDRFKKGQRVFSVDLDQAIAYWEEALTYEPDHERAQLFLERARRIKKKLQAVSE